eukprot:CAMPEP_0196752646 /NCGR_PEP_ID=MMETSP1091-20130531/87778_1 /TAXON_ID=302021 /ORGANISM="Rhodomonas sp., Strain CCMP768" /LENGTH=242 /DNA_ID=CAMNT_0042100621 /DNA_START=1 /DNA_END=725 /DNA_ORIENTATION=-
MVSCSPSTGALLFCPPLRLGQQKQSQLSLPRFQSGPETVKHAEFLGETVVMFEVRPTHDDFRGKTGNDHAIAKHQSVKVIELSIGNAKSGLAHIAIVLVMVATLSQSFSCRASWAQTQTPAESSSSQSTETAEVIHNKPLRYGNYCGPGPGELNPEQGCRMLPHLPAADKIDRECFLHDQAYCKCRQSLESKGKPFFPALFPLMVIRGELPAQLGDALLRVDRDFSLCVHDADRSLAHNFQV